MERERFRVASSRDPNAQRCMNCRQRVRYCSACRLKLSLKVSRGSPVVMEMLAPVLARLATGDLLGASWRARVQSVYVARLLRARGLSFRS